MIDPHAKGLGDITLFVVEPGDPRLANSGDTWSLRKGYYYVTQEELEEIRSDPRVFPAGWRNAGVMIDGELAPPLLPPPAKEETKP